jgi:hypothetical protein
LRAGLAWRRSAGRRRLAMKHATSPPLSENATSAPTFADVARFIAGPDAPTWLVEHFARWSPSLMLDCSAEKMQFAK